MSTAAIDEAVKQLGLFHSILKSIDSFSEIEVWGVVHGVLAPSLHEECVIATYNRAFSNVKSLLELKHVQHFQVIGMIARSLFELTVDIKLIDLVEGAPLKMLHFKDVERLRACESVTAFKKKNKSTGDPTASLRDSFIATDGPRIRSVAGGLWPTLDLKRLSHWSGLGLYSRVKLLGIDFEEIYACHYKQLSWNIHPGLQGVVGLRRETFPQLCIQSLHLSTIVYEDLIRSVIKTFKLFLHDGSLDDKLKFARYVPLTEGPADEFALRRELGL